MIMVCNSCERSFKPEEHTEEDGKTWTDTTCPMCGFDAVIPMPTLREHSIKQEDQEIEDAKVAVTELALTAEIAAERICEMDGKQRRIESELQDIKLTLGNIEHLLRPTDKVPDNYHIGDFIVALLHRVGELEENSAWQERQMKDILGVEKKVRDHQEDDQTVLADLS